MSSRRTAPSYSTFSDDVIRPKGECAGDDQNTGDGERPDIVHPNDVFFLGVVIHPSKLFFKISDYRIIRIPEMGSLRFKNNTIPFLFNVVSDGPIHRQPAAASRTMKQQLAVLLPTVRDGTLSCRRHSL